METMNNSSFFKEEMEKGRQTENSASVQNEVLEAFVFLFVYFSVFLFLLF